MTAAGGDGAPESGDHEEQSKKRFIVFTSKFVTTRVEVVLNSDESGAVGVRGRTSCNAHRRALPHARARAHTHTHRRAKHQFLRGAFVVHRHCSSTNPRPASAAAAAAGIS